MYTYNNEQYNRIHFMLKKHYNIDVREVLPQQGGWAALAFKVTDEANSYFLKIYDKNRASTQTWTAGIDSYVPVTAWLSRNSGLSGKMPVPLATVDEDCKCEDTTAVYLLYEYIDGETIGDKKLSGEEVHQFSAIIAELHSFGENIPVKTDTLLENFHIPFLEPLEEFLTNRWNQSPQDVMELIKPFMKELLYKAGFMKKLAARLKSTPVNMCLCHRDLHPWNMMRSEGNMILIDWEGLTLAPAESDFIFLTDKPYYEDFINIYRKKHPDFTLNDRILLFYQLRRVMEDIWEFIEQLVYDQQSIQEREASFNYLREELEQLKHTSIPFQEDW